MRAARVAVRTQWVLAAIHTDPPPMRPGTPHKILDKAFVREEVACLLRWSPAVTGSRMHDATAPLDPAQVAKVETRVLPRAGEQKLANFHRCV